MSVQSLSLAREIEKEVSEINSKFANRLVTGLNRANPKLTGLSRSNWAVAFVNNQRTTFPISALSTVRQRVQNVIQGKDLTETFYIYNNINYIVDLAQGSSQQAPRGWVDREILNAANAVYGSS